MDVQEIVVSAMDKSIKYTFEKNFTQNQVQQLFLSVNWVSGNYPERLYKALKNSSTNNSMEQRKACRACKSN